MNCLREQQVAEVLNVSVHTLRKWRSVGRGPRFVKIGGALRRGHGQAGRVVYRESDVLAFIESQVVSTVDQPEGCP